HWRWRTPTPRSTPIDLSLSRFNHRVPRGEDEPSMMEGTADVPHPSAAAHLPEAAAIFDAATALDTAMDMLDPQPTLVERLVRHVLLPRELLPQIEINSTARPLPPGRLSSAGPTPHFGRCAGRAMPSRPRQTRF